MNNNYELINFANNVIHYYGHGGYPGGSFTEALLVAIARADHENRGLLGAVYPLEVGLMTAAMEDANGISFVAGIAEGDDAALAEFHERFEDGAPR